MIDHLPFHQNLTEQLIQHIIHQHFFDEKYVELIVQSDFDEMVSGQLPIWSIRTNMSWHYWWIGRCSVVNVEFTGIQLGSCSSGILIS